MVSTDRQQSRQGLAPRIGKACRLALSSPVHLRRSLKLLANCATQDGRAAFVRTLRGLSLPPVGRVDYTTWLAHELASRGDRYPLPEGGAEDGLFSFMTTVYDTPAFYVQRLRQTIDAQTFDKFEWILLDNGSSSPETLAAIDELREDPRVRYQRVEQNLGILGGMRHCLERATGRYVIPLDSDDLLTADALQILAWTIRELDEPGCVFSDEDKVRDDEVPFDAYFKPAWDPVLFWNSCYIAHLCAFRRDRAHELDVYTDDDAQGCHDWDTYFRFWSAGDTPVHVPAVLYSWRLHPASCSDDIFSKSYIFDSHRSVLGRNLRESACGDRFDLEMSPLFEGTPDWWVRRRMIDAPPVSAIIAGAATAEPVPAWLEDTAEVGRVQQVTTGDTRELREALGSCREAHDGGDGLVLIAWHGARPLDRDWVWDAIGLCERFPDTAVVGPRLRHPNGTVASAGLVPAFGGRCGSPDDGRDALDPGYFAGIRKQRSISAASPLFCFVRPEFLRAALAAAPELPFGLLGAWLGAFALQSAARVVYTPYVDVEIPAGSPSCETVSRQEWRRFRNLCGEFMTDSRYYAPQLSLARIEPFAPCLRDTREQELARALETT